MTSDPSALDAIRITLDPNLNSILPVALAAIMFAVALSLKPADFTFLKQDPVRFGGAALMQLLGLPILTLGLIYLIEPRPSVALGMIVVACCPGGTVSNFFSHLARADTALSVSLTATSSLLAALLTPVSIIVWSSLYGPTDQLVTEIALDPMSFIIQTTIILAIPLALGMGLAVWQPRIAARIRPFFSGFGLLVLATLVITGVQGNWDVFISAGLGLFAIVVLHNALAFLLGWGSGRVIGFDAGKRRALTIEIGIQNSGLAIIILLGQFGGVGGAAAITVMWGVWHLIAGLTLAGVFRYVMVKPDKTTEPS